MARHSSTPEEIAFFVKCAKFLYGDKYAAPLAHFLGTDSSRIRAWRNGRSTIPRGVLIDMQAEVFRKKPEFDELLEAVKMMLPERQA